MPQLIGLALVGAGVWAGIKAFQHLADRLGAGQRSVEAGPGEPAAVAEKDLGRLELDPATGVYRPAEREAGS